MKKYVLVALLMAVAVPAYAEEVDQTLDADSDAEVVFRTLRVRLWWKAGIATPFR